MPESLATPEIDEFFQHVRSALLERDLILLTLSKPVSNTAGNVTRLSVRPVEVRGQRLWQWTSHARQETHENLNREQSLAKVMSLLGAVYRDAHLYSTHADVSLRMGKSGRARLTVGAPTKQASPNTQHDRQKKYLIPEGEPCAFLHELGVMTADGRVHRAKQDKFRQINRFLEFVNDVLPHLPTQGRLEVVDFGCGLSYLTFALHHLLTVMHARDVQIVGIDQNTRVIERCTQTVRSLGLPGIEFHARPIRSAENRKVHLAVALHACDTATDDALAQAVRWEANVILAAPCCQHELAPQLASEPLRLLLRHGILRERLASMATDALRAAALEAAGYRTQVMEFIDTEHTPKNLLIRAVRRSAGTPSHDESPSIADLQQILGFRHQRLLDLLAIQRDQ